LLKLIFVDSSASPDPQGKIHLDHLEAVQRRIKEIESRGYTKAHQPKLLVTGTDLMKKLKLEPGPEIGRLLGIIRGAQLAGTINSSKGAIALAKKAIKDV